MNPVSGFFALNRRLSCGLADRLPQAFTHHLHTLYKYQVAEMLDRQPGQVVVDVGGGKECPFLPYVADPQSHLVIALDCSADELRGNRRVDLKIVGDATGPGFPVRDESVDLVVSRSLVEHLRDNDAYFANCARALRPGGTMIHAFPCRFTPFALLNQILPNRLTRRLIAYFLPDWAKTGNYGFVTFYHRCYFSAVQKLLRENRLKNERYIFTYYQSIYFTSFFPLFCIMVSYDLMVWALRIRNLASGMLVTAERSAEAPIGQGAETHPGGVLAGAVSDD
jgi:ubiquinone/menaquinone biosynthesis C-methylase UbiE